MTRWRVGPAVLCLAHTPGERGRLKPGAPALISRLDRVIIRKDSGRVPDVTAADASQRTRVRGLL